VDKIYLDFETPWWPKEFKGFNTLWADIDADTVTQHWSSQASKEELLMEIDRVITITQLHLLR
jgi:hypothetical protein